MHIPPVETSTSSSFIHLKKKIMRYQNFAFTKAYRRLSYFACLCIFLTISSCSDEKSGSTTSTSTETPKEQVAATGTICSDFAFLALSADTLRKIFTNQMGGSRSSVLTFRFGHDGTSNGKVFIEGFATEQSGHKYLKRPPVLLELLSLKASYPNQKIYLADLEFTRDMYNSLPPAGANTHLIFTPNLSLTDPYKNCITYRVAWGTPSMITSDSTAAALVAGGELNPSPPADPGE
jgi:hypothetical protein